MTHVGIDPGLHGCIAILHSQDNVEVHKMPKDFDLVELSDILDIVKKSGGKAIIERQIIKPMIGKKPCPHCKTLISYTYSQKGIITSLTNYGILIGMMSTKGIPFEEVDGSTWKKVLSLEGTKKAGSIKLAKQLYPQMSQVIGKNDNVAEAILLADYGRRVC